MSNWKQGMWILGALFIVPLSAEVLEQYLGISWMVTGAAMIFSILIWAIFHQKDRTTICQRKRGVGCQI